MIYTEEFNSFVTNYVSVQYDFSPYLEILGKDVIELLNRMQSPTPDQRPSIDEVLDILNREKAEKILENTL